MLDLVERFRVAGRVEFKDSMLHLLLDGDVQEGGKSEEVFRETVAVI